MSKPAMSSPVGFAHPTFRRLRPKTDPEAQVAACTELRDGLLLDGIDSVTTELPKRGGVAVMVGWQTIAGKRTPVEGPFYITPEGEVSA
jgi:hypothetical protein